MAIKLYTFDEVCKLYGVTFDYLKRKSNLFFALHPNLYFKEHCHKCPFAINHSDGCVVTDWIKWASDKHGCLLKFLPPRP